MGKPSVAPIDPAIGRGSPRRARLPIIDSPVNWTPLPGVPENRDVCRGAERPCPYVRCAFHLWRVDSEDREGQPQRGVKAATTVIPRWLELRTPACCALDVAEARLPGVRADVIKIRDESGNTISLDQHLSAGEVGNMLMISERRVQQIVRVALAKLKLSRIARRAHTELVKP